MVVGGSVDGVVYVYLCFQHQGLEKGFCEMPAIVQIQVVLVVCKRILQCQYGFAQVYVVFGDPDGHGVRALPHVGLKLLERCTLDTVGAGVAPLHRFPWT